MTAPTMSEHSPRGDQIPTLLVLMATLTALHWLGGSTLATPSVATLTRRSDLAAWIAEEGPVTVALVGIRVVSLAVGYHLLATLVVESAARAAGRHRLARRLQHLSFPRVRSVLGAAAGFAVGLATSGPAGAAPPSTTATLTHLPPDTSESNLAASSVRSRTATAIITRLGPASSDSDLTPTTPLDSTATLTMIEPETPAPAGSPATGATTVTDPAKAGPNQTGQNSDPGETAITDHGPDALGSAGRTHIVVPGDHLWALAEAEVSASPAPGAVSVDAYWRRVVLANPQLQNPDLLFAGQEITLPPLPG